MAIFIDPDTSKEDFEALRRIPNADFPDTYNEWLDLLSKEAARLVVTPGNTIRRIKVDPDEFRRHCAATRRAPNLQELRNFLVKNAGLGGQ
jgi:hypothetical protein